MSTTATKRSYADALRDAEAFRDLFPRGSYADWEIAGSLRRRKSEVGDVEHVVMPQFAARTVPGDGLFASSVTETVNLVWHRLDELVADGTVAKHVYSTRIDPNVTFKRGDDFKANGPAKEIPVYRWGDKYRGVDFRGFNHEIFMAAADNWGSVLAIRTGPAEYSQWLVTRLRGQNRRNKDGKVWRCEPCSQIGAPGHGALCGDCQGTNLKPAEVIPAPDEATYFQLCGIPFLEPQERKEPSRW